MTSGGYRAGAGRPRKPENELSKPRRKKSEIATKKNSTVPSNSLDLTPMEYALQVMNDAAECRERRDRFCILLLPYFHSKKGGTGINWARKQLSHIKHKSKY